MANFSSFQIILIVLFVISGSLNTISVTFMNMMESAGSDGKVRNFLHPFVQADFMFAGELLCLAVFSMIFFVLQRRNDGTVEENTITRGSRMFNRLVLWPPALLDIGATSIMYAGLTLTNASSFQMLRGSVIIFVALLTLVVLKRKIAVREWIGMAFIVFSLIMVGMSDIFQNSSAETVNHTDKNAILGDFLVIFAQLLTATQMVYEEVFVKELDIPPLQMVGWEGFFGYVVLTMFLFPLTLIPAPKALAYQNAIGTLEDPIDALVQIANNLLLLIPIIGLILSMAFYNFTGISITKECNATTRMVLDSVRILVVWCFSLAIGWQEFHYLQVIIFFINFYNF